MNEIVGVGFLIFATVRGLPRMYTVEELAAKPAIFKEVGMIGPPFETMESQDGNIEGTLARLIKEETPFSTESVALCEIIPRTFRLIPGRPDVITRYAYGIFKGDPEKDIGPVDHDIRFAGWHTLGELSGKFLRIEVSPILEDFRRHGHFAKLLHML